MTAGTLSGVGSAGGDVMTKALMTGAAGRFAGLEAQRLGEIEGREQELMLGKGAAESAAKASQREIAKLIAQTRGQQSAAALNPFDVANAMMTFGGNKVKFAKLLQGLGSGSGATGKAGSNKWEEMYKDLLRQNKVTSALSSPGVAGISSGLTGLLDN
jgi:hypothetical protein